MTEGSARRPALHANMTPLPKNNTFQSVSNALHQYCSLGHPKHQAKTDTNLFCLLPLFSPALASIQLSSANHMHNDKFGTVYHALGVVKHLWRYCPSGSRHQGCRTPEWLSLLDRRSSRVTEFRGLGCCCVLHERGPDGWCNLPFLSNQSSPTSARHETCCPRAVPCLGPEQSHATTP